MCGVADLYIVDFGGGEQERARRETEREAERHRLAERYTRYLVAGAEVDQAAARRVITAMASTAGAPGTRNAARPRRLAGMHGGTAWRPRS